MLMVTRRLVCRIGHQRCMYLIMIRESNNFKTIPKHLNS
jgi:hypothetical protein